MNRKLLMTIYLLFKFLSLSNTEICVKFIKNKQTERCFKLFPGDVIKGDMTSIDFFQSVKRCMKKYLIRFIYLT